MPRQSRKTSIYIADWLLDDNITAAISQEIRRVKTVVTKVRIVRVVATIRRASIAVMRATNTMTKSTRRGSETTGCPLFFCSRPFSLRDIVACGRALQGKTDHQII